MTFRLVAGAALGLAFATTAFASTAFAQSYNAPAGIPSATAPGGTKGIAGPGNVARYEQRFERTGIVSVDGVYTTGSVRGHQVRGER